MGLLDVLRGQRPARRADLDRIFGIASAATTLEASIGLRTTGRAGVCFRSIDSGVFAELIAEIEELLRATSQDSGTTISRHDDAFGFSWVAIADPDVEDLATTCHVVSQSLEERGFSEQLLCAIFAFDGALGELDLVYGYKRGTFYPFAPRPGKTRDGVLERRVQAILASEISLESELERWYPVWDAPLDSGASTNVAGVQAAKIPRGKDAGRSHS